MRRMVLAASVAAVMSVAAVPSTASACDPNSPTCGSGTVVENVVNWAEWRAGQVVDAVEDRLDAVECSPNLC